MDLKPLRSILMAATIAACAGDPAGTDAPANVVIRTAQVVRITGGERVTATLENIGGAGTFKIQGSTVDLSTMQSVAICESEPYEVVAGWKETASWTCATGSLSQTALAVLTRIPGSIQYRETSRVGLKADPSGFKYYVP